MQIEDVGALYENYYGSLYRYIYCMTLNNHDTEDVLQNVFIKVMKSKERFRGDSQVKTWLFSIAHNECINYLNKNRKLVPSESFDISIVCESNAVERNILQKEEIEQVMRFIHNCKEPVRSLLVLRLIEERPFAEIGGIIGKSDTWCRVTFFRAKKNLINSLEHGKEVEE